MIQSPSPAYHARQGPRRSRSRGLLPWLVVAVAAVDLALVLGILVTTAPLRSIAASPSSWDDTLTAAVTMAVEAFEEEPHFAVVRGEAVNPICDDVKARQAEALADGFDLMRQTVEGERLFQELIDEGICVRTGNIAYNSGYARVVQSITGSWSRSYIKVDDRHVDGDDPDVLAALLVHEATHVDRYLRGTACSYSDSCTVLPNGVELEEEIAAHRAEAEWWIAAYGRDGKRFAIGYDYGMNELVSAFLEGQEAFAAYVREIRSDARDGAGT